jgi:hypothetical protein
MTPVTSIGVELSIVGKHSWPLAPEHRNYLAVPHEHVFGISVELSVDHPDRAVEFHDLRAEVLEIIDVYYSASGAVYDFQHNSCESIATTIASSLVHRHGCKAKVKVSEDGVCWGKVALW